MALLDQLSKAWVLQNLRGNPPIVLWQDATTGQVWFEFMFTFNKGAAWGIFHEHTEYLAALSAVMIVVIGAVLFNARKEERLLSTALALMLGGAFGNLLDRLIHKQVTDFLHVYLPIGGLFDFLGNRLGIRFFADQYERNMPNGIYDFPIFNIADSAVVVGTVLLLIALMRPLPLPDAATPMEEASPEPLEVATPSEEPVHD